MPWSETTKRRLVNFGSSTLLLVAACGGGDKNPTGPGGGGDAATYDLVALGRAGLPADAQLEPPWG